MEHKEIFAKNLKRYMALAGKSRKDVCEALGYSYFTFSDWVNGKKMPRMDKVEQLANYFGILKSDLIEEKKEAITENGNGVGKSKQQLLDFAMGCSEDEAEKFLHLLRFVKDKIQ